MKIISFLSRFSIFSVLLVSLFGCASLPMNSGDTDAVLNIKRTLPLCTRGDTLYKTLEKLGEQPFGTGTEHSKFAIERKGISIAFLLDRKTGAWSVLNSDNTRKTCFVAMGRKWRKPAQVISRKLVPSDAKKQVGFSAPFGKIQSELLKEGKIEVGYGDPVLVLSGSDIIKVTTYFFTDDFGAFSMVTSVVYSKFEMSSIDATGSNWIFTQGYDKYAW